MGILRQEVKMSERASSINFYDETVVELHELLLKRVRERYPIASEVLVREVTHALAKGLELRTFAGAEFTR